MAYKVLIVDDEEIVCRGLAQFVKWEEHDFQVAGMAYRVDDALVLLGQLSIDVVFMDIRMPEKTGLDLLQIIQEKYNGIKSVILSGFSEFSYAREAMRYGAVDYLTKPVNLSEVENLLERFREEFDKERTMAQIRSNRLEELLLSVARGYSRAETEKCQLPELGRWYGLSVGLLNKELEEAEITEKKQQIREMIEAVVLDAYLLNHEVYSVFVILPCHSETEKTIHMVAQFLEQNNEWACGISKLKNGIKDLREAFEEAKRALHYQKVGEKSGCIWYKNIEVLFSQNTPEIQDTISRVICTLTNPELRANAAGQLMSDLNQMINQQITLMQFQTICIQCLIELNGFLQGMKIRELDLHGALNKILEQIMLCDDFFSVTECMSEHMMQMTRILEKSDEQYLGKGIIKEIQLFILKHFDENITLNMLAGQFYLHPNYLSRLFKEKTGKNFVEYMTEVRMEEVKKLLKDTEDKVSDISEQVGYENPRYFSKVFKQYTGLTPREYREQMLL